MTPSNAYVLHTGDGGKSWRPQAISPGVVGGGGIVAGDASKAFALVKARGGASASRQLFATATGGDAGAASPLKIKAKPSKFTRRTLKSTKGKVTISGTLAGAIGGEQVTISARAVNGVDWTSRTVTAGANGGSFSATFNIKNPAVFVAQWAGDSGAQRCGHRAADGEGHEVGRSAPGRVPGPGRAFAPRAAAQPRLQHYVTTRLAWVKV